MCGTFHTDKNPLVSGDKGMCYQKGLQYLKDMKKRVGGYPQISIV